MRTRARLASRLREACLWAGFTLVCAAAQAADDIAVRIESNLVRVRVQESSLRQVLEEMSRQTGLVVQSQAALDQRISFDITAPTVGAAIRRLLGNRSYMLFQSQPIDTGNRIGVAAPDLLWVFADASGNHRPWTALPAPQNQHDVDAADIAALAVSARAGDRQEAMYAIADLGDSGHIAYLEQGLSDHDEDVREAAITALGEMGGPGAVRMLGLALYDPSPGLRMDAVYALGDIGDEQAVELLQQSLPRQPDAVREAAAAMLTEIAWPPDPR